MSDITKLEKLIENYRQMRLTTEKNRYDRLEALAEISVHLDELARMEGFGEGSVATYAQVILRDKN
jgi:hypothetical protein